MQTSPVPRWALVCLYGAGAIMALTLLVQHWVHVPIMLPWLLFLACPLVHLFMHKRHSHHRHGRDGKLGSES